MRNNNPLNIRHGHSQWQGRTEAYLNRVIKLTGVTAMQPLPEPRTAEGYRVLHDIIIAMTCVENGIKPAEVPVSAILQGYQLAFSH